MPITNVQALNVGINGAVGFTPIRIKQHDKNTRRIEITLLEGSDIFEIPNGAVAKFQATKPDGKIILDDCSIENDMIIYKAIEELSTCAGIVKCEVGLYSSEGDELLQSSTFDILVDKSAMDRNTVTSSDEFRTLTIMINTITGLVENATTMLSEVETALSNTEIAISNTEIAISNAEQATIEAQQATDSANSIVQSVQTDLDNGAFDGATWYTGSTTPSSTLGKNEDLYLNITSDDVYLKTNGIWTVKCNIKGSQGDRGIDGEKGSIWITGTGIPSNSIGRNGDYYLNSDQNANDVYEKTNDVWAKKCNIKGESGVYISTTDDVIPPDWATVWIVINNEATSTIEGQLYDKLDKTGDATDTTVAYTEPTTEEELVSGNKIGSIIGKISKKLALLKSGKIDKTSVVNNLVTTVEGTVLDGRIGKVLSDKVGNLSSLTTVSKTDLVGSVNEVKAGVNDVNNNLTEIDSDLDTVTSNINTIKNNIYSFVDLQSSEYTKSLNSYINCETGTVGSVDWLNTIYVPCVSGQLYDVSTCVVDSSVAAILFLDSNNGIISYMLRSDGSSTKYINNNKVTIPENCTKMVITETPNLMNAIVKKYSNIMYNGTQNILNNKKILFSGDSFQEGAINGGGWSKHVKEETGAITNNVAVGGSTITVRENVANGIYNQIINRTDKSSYDYVIFEGGVNDYWITSPIGTITEAYDSSLDTSTVCGALESICRDLVKNYSAKVGFIIPHRTSINTFAYQESYFNTIKQVLRKYCIPYLDLFNESMMNPNYVESKNKYFKDDGIHANASGYAFTKYQVIRFIEGL